ncbi:MAG: hypothetical protein ABSG15_00185 [FCB group bacterium]
MKNVQVEKASKLGYKHISFSKEQTGLLKYFCKYEIYKLNNMREKTVNDNITLSKLQKFTKELNKEATKEPIWIQDDLIKYFYDLLKKNDKDEKVLKKVFSVYLSKIN